MKKLLQINTVINYGAIGRIAEEIGNMVIQNGWKSYIAFGRKARQSSSETIKIGNNLNVLLHAVQSRLFDNQALASVNPTKTLISMIEEMKPDIIHLHNLHGYYINIEVLFNYLSCVSTPVIWTLHDCWPITGHCVHFDYVQCEKWKTGCFSCPQKNSYPRSILWDRSVKNYILKKNIINSLNNLTIVPVSNWLGEIIKKSFLSEYPVKVIHNGVNIRLFTFKESTIREKYNLKNKFIILGVTNNWSARKGLLDFVKLSNNLDSNYQIIIVGLSKKQLNNLPENIIGVKRTESIQELAELYSSADVFLNPTWEDNFPTTNLESLACGTPVITYNTGGSKESISPETGYVIEKGNIKQIIESIIKIRENGKQYYSLNCIKQAQNNYNKDNRYLEYLSLYESKLTIN